jgi:murein DD-endopeptidase MepM/ murein hydrolase activator NlpD
LTRRRKRKDTGGLGCLTGIFGFALFITVIPVITTLATGTIPASAHTIQTPPSGGAFVWPVEGSTRITSPFGYRLDPETDGHSEFHTGVDIGANAGTHVRAVAPGEVTFAGWDGNYGNKVAIRHSGSWVTWYGHLQEFLVRKGDIVAAGDLIGLVGSTGRSTGPHLHLEVRVNDEPVDPLMWLSP